MNFDSNILKVCGKGNKERVFVGRRGQNLTCDAVKHMISKLAAKLPFEFSSFNRIGYDIGYYLSQIRVLCSSYDITVFDIREDKITNITRTLPLKKFLSRIDSIYTTNTNDSDNYQKINNTSLTTILLIFNEKGLENYIESIFEQEFQINKPYLYTETSGYCFKIIFEFQDLKLIMRNVYGILEFTQPSYFSQEN